MAGALQLKIQVAQYDPESAEDAEGSMSPSVLAGQLSSPKTSPGPNSSTSMGIGKTSQNVPNSSTSMGIGKTSQNASQNTSFKTSAKFNPLKGASSNKLTIPPVKATVVLPDAGGDDEITTSSTAGPAVSAKSSIRASVMHSMSKVASLRPQFTGGMNDKTAALEERGLVEVNQNGGPKSAHLGKVSASLYHKRTRLSAAKGDGAFELQGQRSGTENLDEVDGEEPVIRVASCFGPFAQAITIINTVVAAWSGFIVPLYFAYQDTFETFESITWDNVIAVTQASDLLYFICHISSLRIAYIDLEYNEEVYVPGLIACHRLGSPLFWMDLVSCVPISLSNPISGLLKFCRTYRLMVVSITFQHLQFKAGIQIGRMVCSVMYASHLLACLWYYIINSQGHFQQYLISNYGAALDAGKNPSPYLVALRDAVFMMFNRPVHALNDAELALNIMMAPVGAMVIATIFGNINWLFQRMNARSMKHFEELSTVEQALKGLHGVPSHLGQRIIDYYRYLQIHHDNRTHDALLKGLSPTLLLELKLYLYADLLSHAPFFADGVPPQIIKAMVMVLNLCIFSSGDFVIHRNETASAMYFIVRGMTEVLLELDSPPVVCFYKGQYFGEMALYRSVDKQAKRTAWVRAVSFCHLARLTRESFEDILHEFPAESHILLDKIGDVVETSDRFNNGEGGRGSIMSHMSLLNGLHNVDENSLGDDSEIEDVPEPDKTEPGLACGVESNQTEQSLESSLAVSEAKPDCKVPDQSAVKSQKFEDEKDHKESLGIPLEVIPLKVEKTKSCKSEEPELDELGSAPPTKGAQYKGSSSSRKSTDSSASQRESTSRQPVLLPIPPTLELPDLENASEREISVAQLRLQSQNEQRLNRLEVFLQQQFHALAKDLGSLASGVAQGSMGPGAEPGTVTQSAPVKRLEQEFQQSNMVQEQRRQSTLAANNASSRVIGGRGSVNAQGGRGSVNAQGTESIMSAHLESRRQTSTDSGPPGRKTNTGFLAKAAGGLKGRHTLMQSMRNLGGVGADPDEDKNAAELVESLFNTEKAAKTMPKGLARSQTKTLKKRGTTKLK